MPPSQLTPSFELLCKDYVLIQAWKKTARYIRSHNWFSDILALDLTEIDLPRFLGELAERLATPEDWQTERIRMVPAPKSQPWSLDQNGAWKPAQRRCRLRPLAHLKLRDQVAATAVMLCLADRVETLQGDPKLRVSGRTPATERTISYGNRLLCDRDEDTNHLRYRWGSVGLYRGYFQDYKTFISRPTIIAEKLSKDATTHTYIICADLREFYDRISPCLIHAAIERQLPPECDNKFRILVKNLFSWTWHDDDKKLVRQYEKDNKITSFQTIALPQGLASAGFFSNVLMLGLDEMLRDLIHKEIREHVTLIDVCRYVDDFRLVVTVDRKITTKKLRKEIVSWLQERLAKFESSLGTAKGSFLVSKKKTSLINVASKNDNVVYQSQRMNRIEQGISGGFDARQGIELLNAIEALISSQRRFDKLLQGQNWAWSLTPDTNDGTVKRFAAGRFRKTYRSLRPLLESIVDPDSGDVPQAKSPLSQMRRSTNERTALDHDAKVFAYSLISDWTNDASNVRLLRIALDLWPSPQLLAHVLTLLRTLTTNYPDQVAPESRVAWYCIAELFRVATFETGCVSDEELLPTEADVKGYRKMLYNEAVRISKSMETTLPWYVRESILFFLAAYGGSGGDQHRQLIAGSGAHYQNLFALIYGDYVRLSRVRFVRYLVLIRRSFPKSYRNIDASIEQHINGKCFRTLVKQDPSYAIELIGKYTKLASFIKNTHAVDDLGLRSVDSPELEGFISLSKIVTQEAKPTLLRDELSLIQFSLKFLEKLNRRERYDQIRPTEVFVRIDKTRESIEEVRLKLGRVTDSSLRSFYSPPSWCSSARRWRFHLGFLLRFLVTRSQDFTRLSIRRTESKGGRMYRTPRNHWYHRIHGLYNAQAGLGDNWLLISQWFEDLLFRLLAWPGNEVSNVSRKRGSVLPTLEDELETLKRRGDRLVRLKGAATRVLILPMHVPFPYERRNLRACVVQTGFPLSKDLEDDHTLTLSRNRRIHRNHLAAALSTVSKTLYWRQSHQLSPHALDLLVLPELSVNALDIESHLKPFALKYKSIIVAGLTYRELEQSSDKQLVNSAIWVIPYQSIRGGWNILTRCQGKLNIAPAERALVNGKVSGFRPCQWLVEYDSLSAGHDHSLSLTASICYDATDLGLAADLRNASDVFIVPAFNKDVETFDTLAKQLHYDMFQMVAIVNCGEYGGSCVWWPRKGAHERRVFHSHGQSQCTIGFFDIDVEEFLQRKDPSASDDWKSVPAGVNREERR